MGLVRPINNPGIPLDEITRADSPAGWKIDLAEETSSVTGSKVDELILTGSEKPSGKLTFRSTSDVTKGEINFREFTKATLSPSEADGLLVENKTANARIRISSGDGVSYYLSGILIEENRVPRWSIAKSNEAAGYLYITRFNDAGAAIDSPLVIHRDSGAVQMYGKLVVRNNLVAKFHNTDDIGLPAERFANIYGVNVWPEKILRDAGDIEIKTTTSGEIKFYPADVVAIDRATEPTLSIRRNAVERLKIYHDETTGRDRIEATVATLFLKSASLCCELVSGGQLLPALNGANDIGDDLQRWRNAYFSKSGNFGGTLKNLTFEQTTAPTAADIPDGHFAWWWDTSLSRLWLCYNRAGTVRMVELT